MTKTKGGLGRGLDSLISDTVNNSSSDHLTVVAIADIQPDRYQACVQVDDEALQGLADSIKAQGIIQPVIVRGRGLSQYELTAGEHHWRTSQLAGLTEVPVIVKTISDETALAMGLIENLRRENLNPIEEAQGLKRLTNEFGLAHETIAKVVGRSRSAISGGLHLLSLPEPVQEMLYQHHLEVGHARALLALHVVGQLELAQGTVRNDRSVREVERYSQLAHQETKSEATRTISPDVRRANDALIKHLGVNVEVRTGSQKRGKIVLHFGAPEAFEYSPKQLDINQTF